ncbi:MAG: SRPBCC family protein [Gemmatimonadota bacterium]|nr:SRPBCC family protein [Gemmatimonadota bacterium]
MKRIAIGAIVVGVGLFALVYLIGLLLPESHVASVRTVYEASPARVFETISDIEGQPEWRPSVERIEALPPREGKPAWREIGSTGPLPMELTESEPPRRMVTTILSDGLPFGGRWIYEVEPTPAGAALTITEEGEVYNPIFRFVSRFIMGHRGTATTYLRDLGRELGSEADIEIVR